jgi:hypothetical protein
MIKKLVLTFVLLMVSVGHADISGRTLSNHPYIDLRSTLNGTGTEALIDAAQLAMALSSMYSGESMLLDAVRGAMGGGSLSPHMNRVQGAWDAYNETAQLLDSLSDKSIHKEAYVKISKDSRREFFNIGMTVNSDDDPFGVLRVDVKRSPHLYVTKRGLDSRDAAMNVKIKPKYLNPGIYPIVFTAKEKNCRICLSIVHTVFVEIYDPCPNLAPICTNDVNVYNMRTDEYRAASAPFMSMVSRGKAIVRRMKANENTCFNLLRPATGGGSSDAVRDAAQRNFDRCINNLLTYERQNKGSCPDVGYGLNSSECTRYRGKDQFLQPYANRVNQAKNKIITDNCCHEFVNPDGGTGLIPLDPNRGRFTVLGRR